MGLLLRAGTARGPEGEDAALQSDRDYLDVGDAPCGGLRSTSVGVPF